ncbi:MAG: hypothetical protein ACRDYW_01725 [Acidimicrobiales bacterium]
MEVLPMTDAPPTTSHRRRAGLAVAGGLFAGVGALALVQLQAEDPTPVRLAGVTEDVSGNCDEAEHANDAECAGVLAPGRGDDGTTSTTAGTTTAPTGSGQSQPGDTRVVSAGDAGSITVVSDGTSLGLLTTSPNQGWRVEVEQSAGREVEVTFRSGALRVDVNVELEDGQIRERVRTRNDATGAEIRTEDGVVVRDDGPDDGSSSGPGSDDDGATADDDSSGPGSGDDSSGSGSDDDSGHDSGDDSSSSGSDDGPNHD